MRLTKDVTLSLELMNKLKNRTSPVRVAELAPQLGTTEHYLEQIVNKLRRGGVLTVKRGPGGGITRSSQEPVAVSKIFEALGTKVTYNATVENQNKEDQILAKIEQVLTNETC